MRTICDGRAESCLHLRHHWLSTIVATMLHGWLIAIQTRDKPNNQARISLFSRQAADACSIPLDMFAWTVVPPRLDENVCPVEIKNADFKSSDDGTQLAPMIDERREKMTCRNQGERAGAHSEGRHGARIGDFQKSRFER